MADKIDLKKTLKALYAPPVGRFVQVDVSLLQYPVSYTHLDVYKRQVVVTAPVIVATDDNFGPVNGGDGSTTPSVLGNDSVNGGTVDPSAVTLTPGTSPHPGLMMNPDGTITIAPGTPTGSYSYPYEICDRANPGNCASAVAVITVAGQEALRVTKSAAVREVRILSLIHI